MNFVLQHCFVMSRQALVLPGVDKVWKPSAWERWGGLVVGGLGALSVATYLVSYQLEANELASSISQLIGAVLLSAYYPVVFWRVYGMCEFTLKVRGSGDGAATAGGEHAGGPGVSL